MLFVDHGDVLTSAGATSGVDVCLHLVRQDHGSEVANQIARTCVMPPYRDGGQAQYIERPLPPASGTGTGPTRDWALHRLDLPLSLDEMAAHAAMSARTFSRRFREETGVSPGRWLTQQRLRRARHLHFPHLKPGRNNATEARIRGLRSSDPTQPDLTGTRPSHATTSFLGFWPALCLVDQPLLEGSVAELVRAPGDAHQSGPVRPRHKPGGPQRQHLPGGADRRGHRVPQTP